MQHAGVSANNSCAQTTEVDPDIPSTSFINGDGPQTNIALANYKPESSILLKNVAIIKHYPNEDSTRLEKLEDMRQLLTNIRRRVNNRHFAHTHRDHRWLHCMPLIV